MERWRQTAQDANERPVMKLKKHIELQRLRGKDEKEAKHLWQELRGNESPGGGGSTADHRNKDSSLLGIGGKN